MTFAASSLTSEHATNLHFVVFLLQQSAFFIEIKNVVLSRYCIEPFISHTQWVRVMGQESSLTLKLI